MRKFDRALIPEFPDLSFEAALWEAGLEWVAGVDEAGRGALAGPVAAGVAVLPASPRAAAALNGLKDSKLLRPEERAAWRQKLQVIAVDANVGFASSQEIDELGIVDATRLAVARALEGLRNQPQHLLVDYLGLPEVAIPQTSLVKGDARSLSIAAAAILAKTARDALMCELALEYPEYGFSAHKGYGTAAHRRAIERFGECPIHRRSFHFSQAD